MSKISSMIEELSSTFSEASDHLLDTSVAERFKDMVGKPNGEIYKDIDKLINDCVYYGLTSEVVIRVLEVIKHSVFIEAVNDGSLKESILMFEHYPDNILITVREDSGKFASMCHVNNNGDKGELIIEAEEAVFDTEKEAIDDIESHLKVMMEKFIQARDAKSTEE